MIARWLVAICVLPGTALVLVPLTIIWLSRIFGITTEPADPGSIQFRLAMFPAAFGVLLSLWTMSLFLRFGDGTPAPWDPPQRLVIRGPYRHVRNPMIVSVVMLLFSAALFFKSWPLTAWASVFFIGNAIYCPLVEEPGLRTRFGEDYIVYCQNVGRWIPRLTPWHPSSTPVEKKK